MASAESLQSALEDALAHAVAMAESPHGPALLSKAYHHAVFPGGARIRPQLTLAVAKACGATDPHLAMAAAVALELLHCGSLVHDDLPCFDNSPTRRGQPSVHAKFGERIAVLTGDGLIVLAFQVLATAQAKYPERVAPLMAVIAQATGAPDGIVAGQAWECEPKANLRDYQRAKTGALFGAATACGALASGGVADAWRPLGEWLGEAYQVADDIRDVIGDPALLGKPTGQDLANDRQSSARSLGLFGAIQNFDLLVGKAIRAIPSCPGAPYLRALVLAESERLVPRDALERVQA
jgi:geranylgeranyl diphosphate synthase, type II